MITGLATQREERALRDKAQRTLWGMTEISTCKRNRNSMEGDFGNFQNIDGKVNIKGEKDG